MKVYWMVVFSAFLMVLFHIAGFHTEDSWIVKNLDILSLVGIEQSAFWLKVVALFSLSAVGTAVASAFFSTDPQWIVKSIFIMPTLVLLILDFINVLTMVDGWVYWIVLAIIAPIASGWLIAILEFWEGRD